MHINPPFWCGTGINSMKITKPKPIFHLLHLHIAVDGPCRIATGKK